MLAEKLRPKNLDEFVGQTHLIGKDGPLRKIIESGSVPSMIFWGPPGTGKTTLARLIANYVEAEFVSYSAVMGSIKDVRKIVATAQDTKLAYKKDTILFVDEIHRFNKSQQDAFLPFVEDGTITLIGATTENPGFEVNAPLLSRAQLFVFKLLTDTDIEEIVSNAIATSELEWEKDSIKHIVNLANGDARKAINLVEVAIQYAASVDDNQITISDLEKITSRKQLQYDKKGENHYDTISAFIKSMRGSDPNATLHYLARMLEAGEDPIFIARRMVIFASEDIGNAKPAALILATNTMQAVKMIGMPEAQILLAQCATFLATSKKSVASYFGLLEAISDVRNKNVQQVPKHLRNAANSVMKDLEYGKGYVRYPWHKDFKGEKGLPYLPDNLDGTEYYDTETNSE
jgi:putative ATPase